MPPRIVENRSATCLVTACIRIDMKSGTKEQIYKSITVLNAEFERFAITEKIRRIVWQFC
ncbi:MAG: hypothetical protein SPD42_02140 [Eubacteriales bacterium]|nr:hypothetical protein [Eubacteriales bacterium]